MIYFTDSVSDLCIFSLCCRKCMTNKSSLLDDIAIWEHQTVYCQLCHFKITDNVEVFIFSYLPIANDTSDSYLKEDLFVVILT